MCRTLGTQCVLGDAEVVVRRALVLLLALVCLVALAACGGSSRDDLAGYWSVPGEKLGIESFLLHVGERGGAYAVSVDGGPLAPAQRADGRLVLPVAGPGSRNLELGMDGERPAVFAYVSHDPNPESGEPTGSLWVPFPVHGVAPAAYERRAAAKADGRMRWELFRLELALREWADRHGGVPPVPGQVGPDTAFGRWLQSGAAGLEVPWPINPYTGEALHAGSSPGDFAYRRDGRRFTLDGYLHDGSAFSAVEPLP
jgi:hypothetical protein